MVGITLVLTMLNWLFERAMDTVLSGNFDPMETNTVKNIRKIVLSLAVILLNIAVGTTFYYFSEPSWTLIQAFYWSAMTVMVVLYVS